MIAIIDYGVGNLFSLRSSLAAIGAETVVTGDDLAPSHRRSQYGPIFCGGDHALLALRAAEGVDEIDAFPLLDIVDPDSGEIDPSRRGRIWRRRRAAAAK